MGEKFRARRLSNPDEIVECTHEDLGVDLKAAARAKSMAWRSRFVIGDEVIDNVAVLPLTRAGMVMDSNQFRYVEDNAFLDAHDIDVSTIEYLV